MKGHLKNSQQNRSLLLPMFQPNDCVKLGPSLCFFWVAQVLELTRRITGPGDKLAFCFPESLLTQIHKTLLFKRKVVPLHLWMHMLINVHCNLINILQLIPLAKTLEMKPRVPPNKLLAISHVLNEQGTGYKHIFSSVQTFNINWIEKWGTSSERASKN